MLSRLVDQGNTVIVIEHNLDVVKTADWVIDMGPEGGSGGGMVVVEGTPEDIAAHPTSYTGRFLRPILEGAAPGEKRPARAAVRPIANDADDAKAPTKAPPSTGTQTKAPAQPATPGKVPARTRTAKGDAAETKAGRVEGSPIRAKADATSTNVGIPGLPGKSGLVGKSGQSVGGVARSARTSKVSIPSLID